MSAVLPDNLRWFNHPNSLHVAEFIVEHGTIVADKVWSETHVHSSGGGGYIQQGTGYVNAPTVHSSVQTKRELWFRNREGQEYAIQVGESVKANSGNDVSVVWYTWQGNSVRYQLSIVNRTTRHWDGIVGFESSYYRNLCNVPSPQDSGGCAGGCLVVLVVILAICAAIAFGVNQLPIPAIVAAGVGLGIFASVQSASKEKEKKKNTTQQVRAAAANAFDVHCRKVIDSLWKT